MVAVQRIDNRRKPRPAVAHGEAGQIRQPRRKTIADPPDRRVPEAPVRPLSVAQLRTLARPGAIDPRVAGINRIMERWAVTHGRIDLGYSTADLGARKSSARPDPLSDRESLLVDRAVKGAPDWVKGLVRAWYRTDASVAEICEVLGVKRSAFYTDRLMALSDLQGRLEQMGMRMPYVPA